MRVALVTLALLTGCVFERSPGSVFQLEVSRYPQQVEAGTSFEVLIDVFDIHEPLEVAVTPVDGLRIDETVGGTFVILKVTVDASATLGATSISIALRSGVREGEIIVGFEVVAVDETQ